MNDDERSRTSRSILVALLAALSGCSDGLAPSPDGALTETVQLESEGVYTRSLCPDAKSGARCGRVRVDVNGLPIRMSSPTAFAVPTLGATDLLQAYDVVRDTSHHPTVAVLAFGDYANAESDLGVYRAQYGLPACTSQSGCFTKINKNGATSPLPAATGAVGEMMLDLEMVSAGCPDCNIVLAEADADWSGIEATVASAAARARVITISYLWGEPSTSSGDAWLNIPGTTIFAASGDAGWGDPTYPGFPATSRYVNAVGGTRLARDSTTSRGFTEVAWTSSPTTWAASFSMCSAVFPKPSWQTAATGCTTRASADVSAVASNISTYLQGAWWISSGTSASAPLVAGIYAESHLGGADPGLSYRVLTAFHDIVAGSPDNSSAYYDDNGVRASCGGKPICTVGSGWDGPTGNGTPDGAALDPVRVSLPTFIAANSAVNGSVSLSYAPTQSTTLTLSSTAFGTVPASATIPAGGTSASFLFHSGSVSRAQTVTVTATCANGSLCAGASALRYITVEPPVRSCCVPGCLAPRVCSSNCECVVPRPGASVEPGAVTDFEQLAQTVLENDLSSQ
jgi:subtilase family serine protease